MAREATGPGSGRLEQHLMELLIDIASQCGADSDSWRVPPDVRLVVFELLAPNARDCLALKRVRDAKGAIRKIRAFQIPAYATRHMDLPESAEEARKVVFSPRASGIGAALLLLEEDSRRRDAPLDETVVQRLQTLLARATSRSFAVRIHSFLVVTGVISEFTAQDLLDDRRERHRGG